MLFAVFSGSRSALLRAASYSSARCWQPGSVKLVAGWGPEVKRLGIYQPVMWREVGTVYLSLAGRA